MSNLEMQQGDALAIREELQEGLDIMDGLMMVCEVNAVDHTFAKAACLVWSRLRNTILRGMQYTTSG